jgi:hypothetical protein
MNMNERSCSFRALSLTPRLRLVLYLEFPEGVARPTFSSNAGSPPFACFFWFTYSKYYQEVTDFRSYAGWVIYMDGAAVRCGNYTDLGYTCCALCLQLDGERSCPGAELGPVFGARDAVRCGADGLELCGCGLGEVVWMGMVFFWFVCLFVCLFGCLGRASEIVDCVDGERERDHRWDGAGSTRWKKWRDRIDGCVCRM